MLEDNKRCNQIPEIEGQTTQWPKEKRQKVKRTNNDLQNITLKIKHRATRSPLKKLEVNPGAPGE